ncbi:acyl-CoA thioesterase [Fulvivirga sediminis]|uniref:Thioesterase family protein n=1 Tax=Fulvivirga sediminis TaxID=2803949 RepID=A0A937F8Y3_9BACT|nr:acyl-ACP thioesterase domain-containing protein [Fulvivirga sediminis]MBL3657875.1 thioesterase family protein [Fulvivirga sediminis]
MPYTHHIRVKEEHIDHMGHVNNVVYVQYVQDTAEAHWKNVANEEMIKGTLWIVIRHEIDYLSPAFAGDVLNATTWVEEAEGLKLPRFVSIKNQEGKDIIKARTLWCALDSKSHRPKRISEEMYTWFK